MSAVGIVLDGLRKLPDALKWIAGVIGGVAAIIASCNQLSPTLEPLLSKYLTPLPSELVVYLSPDPLTAKSYLSILADNGFRTLHLDFNEIETLRSRKPGIVIVGTADGRQQPKLSPALQKYLKGGKIKIIGMGWLGVWLYSELDRHSVLTRTAHGFDAAVLLDSKAPREIIADLPTATPVRLYDDNVLPTMNDVAVYDDGSLSLLGAQGIALHPAERPCAGHYWTIVRQGNHFLWGHGEGDAQRLTDTGKRIFVGIVRYAQRTPFEILELDRPYATPGLHKGTLGCNFHGQRYPFRFDRVGDIVLEVTSRNPLALILNSPGQTTVPLGIVRK